MNETITQNVTGWHFGRGAETELFGIGGYWTEYTYYNDGSVKDVEFTVQLEPNNATKALQGVAPFKECKNDGKYPDTGDCLNGAVDGWDGIYYNASGNESTVSNSTAADLSGQLSNVPITVNDATQKTTSVSDKPKNITAKVKLRNGTGTIGELKIGNHSAVFTVSSQTDWENEGTFFNTTSSSGTLLISNQFDGFEDGDFTNGVTWTDTSSSPDSAQVQTQTVEDGSYAVELLDTADGSGGSWGIEGPANIDAANLGGGGDELGDTFGFVHHPIE